MAAALKERKISAPVYILKADGGTLPLDKSVQMPVETIFSGPAASIMGVMALTAPGQTCVVVDIGGTTTDLALILSGKPLLSAKGARVGSLLTHVRAFAVKSVAIGGDSAVAVRRRLPDSRAAPRRPAALHGRNWAHAHRCPAGFGPVEHRRRRKG